MDALKRLSKEAKRKKKRIVKNSESVAEHRSVAKEHNEVRPPPHAFFPKSELE